MLVAMVLLAAYFFKRSHITAALHHPMVWSVAVFGAAHLVANGSGADVVLFGAFLIWAAAEHTPATVVTPLSIPSRSGARPPARWRSESPSGP
jgi:uncharacterized membrane protein